MVRKLKFHEQKLLKKVDFISWEVDNNLSEVKVLRRFRIQRREDYTNATASSYEAMSLINKNILWLTRTLRRRSLCAQETSPVQESRYNKLSRAVRELARKIRDLDEKDSFRTKSTSRLLEKLYAAGLIPTKQGLQLCDKVSASSFCRRRLPTIMLKLRMAQNLKTAITFIEQGRILFEFSHGVKV
ncbi:U3 small nucleolar ribonucleoprotein protein IMP3 isoform X2 [Scyliorhinus torazame]|uniref:U3 small nucleolar ribonucleoprotein protein IMP3 isoform X2 n=1 Tax=Scyliorhinus torazame TaxID=75743 RepID=UPI003B590CEB